MERFTVKLRSSCGASLIEYVTIVAIVAVGLIAAPQYLSDSLGQGFLVAASNLLDESPTKGGGTVGTPPTSLGRGNNGTP